VSVAALIVGDQYLYEFAPRSISHADEEVLHAQASDQLHFETPVIRRY
jgi:hypothetical protein